MINKYVKKGTTTPKRRTCKRKKTKSNEIEKNKLKDI